MYAVRYLQVWDSARQSRRIPATFSIAKKSSRLSKLHHQHGMVVELCSTSGESLYSYTSARRNRPDVPFVPDTALLAEQDSRYPPPPQPRRASRSRVPILPPRATIRDPRHRILPPSPSQQQLAFSSTHRHLSHLPLPYHHILPRRLRQRLLLPIAGRAIYEPIPLRHRPQLQRPMEQLLVLHAHEPRHDERHATNERRPGSLQAKGRQVQGRA